MSNKNTTAGARLRVKSLWRARLSAVGIIAVLMTLSAPICPAQNATLEVKRAEPSPTDFKAYAKHQSSLMFGWTTKHTGCLNRLWGKESAWNPVADNPNSTAFGIAQMLNEKSHDPHKQIRNGLRYISHRYENPCNAWDHWKKRNFY